ncbi:MAG: type I glutamate--ammonia ligase [Wolbachia sp.]|nr:type I glutamate--ammonia ligase [Wolbachia sp.]MDD9336315.1 type I glutamate--ammonia ligase [Wolbachia sp.]
MIDLRKFLEQNSIKLINLCFTDLIGKMSIVTYNADKINDKYVLEGSIQEEITLIPDLQTIFFDPFCVQPTATILCDIVTPAKPYLHDSRSVAKKAYDYILSTKIANEAQFGFEIRFSVFNEVKFRVSSYVNLNDEFNEYYDFTSTVDPLSDLRSEILLMMMESGIEKPLYHKRISPFQGSIRVDSSKFLNSADNIQKAKYVIHNVAHSYGKTATIMPQPIAQGEGNSLCLYHSLLKNNESLFDGDKSEDYLYYIGGIMKHIKAINAYSNPTTNSYKRLIDLPDFSLRSEQIKLSFSDSSANPYLCFSAILMAGFDGIQNKINPDTVQKQTATSLSEALELLDKDREFLLKGKVFTNEQIDQYIKIKHEEIKK